MENLVEVSKVGFRLRVKELRTQKGMSLQEFSQRAGVSYNTALGYDRDNIRYFRREVLAGVASALECTVPDLFEVTEPSPVTLSEAEKEIA